MGVMLPPPVTPLVQAGEPMEPCLEAAALPAMLLPFPPEVLRHYWNLSMQKT
jgi:hypothetical protein